MLGRAESRWRISFPNRRRGFTLVELMVALAIIGVLVALVLPAVQQARESARKMQCRNQLRQLALALHNYHDNKQVLPAGAYLRGPSSPTETGWGWGAMILPHVDQAPLYNQLDFNVETTVGPNVAKVKVTLPAWRCVSDAGDANATVQMSGGALVECATGNYCGVEGMLSGMSFVRFSDVTDGLSQTFMLGERVTQLPAPGRNLITSGWYGILSDETAAVFNSMPYTAALGSHQINAHTGSSQFFSSRHVGGAHFALGDGSVRFVSQEIDRRVFEALGTINGQEGIEF